MNEKEHKKRHKELHGYLDELVADWIKHSMKGTERMSLTNTTIMELMEWSHEQTVLPDL